MDQPLRGPTPCAEHQMNLNLPPPLARYFNAERTDATDLLADIFTADAVVRDEGRAMRGLDAITAWKRDAKAKYQYSVEPIRVTPVTWPPGRLTYIYVA